MDLAGCFWFAILNLLTGISGTGQPGDMANLTTVMNGTLGRATNIGLVLLPLFPGQASVNDL